MVTKQPPPKPLKPLAEGKMAALGDYQIQAFDNAAGCYFCNEHAIPLLSVEHSPTQICEPCSHVFSWIWRKHANLALPSPHSEVPNFVSVLIAKDRPSDPINPIDLLMAPDPITPNFYDLPTFPRPQDVTPEQAALTALKGQGIDTWIGAFEPLYTGYIPRGQLQRVYLLRAYFENIDHPKTTTSQWLHWPSLKHVSPHQQGFHAGIMEAFALRWRLQKASTASTPLSLALSAPAALFLSLKVKEVSTPQIGPPDSPHARQDAALKNSYESSLSKTDKDVINFVTNSQAKFTDAQAMARRKRLDEAERASADARWSERQGFSSDVEGRGARGEGGSGTEGRDEASGVGNGVEEDENAAVDFGGSGDGGGFVRGRAGVLARMGRKGEE